MNLLIFSETIFTKTYTSMNDQINYRLPYIRMKFFSHIKEGKVYSDTNHKPIHTFFFLPSNFLLTKGFFWLQT